MESPMFEQIQQRACSVDIQDFRGQESVTAKLVTPQLGEITSLLLQYRSEVDALFEKKRGGMTPFEYGIVDVNYYPIGFCREIRDNVFKKVARDPLFQRLRASGLILKEIYIILRNTYFQNAIQLGNLYIDIANDTVDTSKPKLEVCPLNSVDFKNLNNYDEYFRVAEKYLRVTLYPNTFFPFFLPICPCLAVDERNNLQLFMHQEVILYKDVTNNFKLVEEFFRTSEISKRRLPLEHEHTLKQLISADPIFRKLYSDASDTAVAARAIQRVKKLDRRQQVAYAFTALDILYKVAAFMQHSRTQQASNVVKQ